MYMYLHIRTHVYVYETSWLTITLNNLSKLVTVCRLLNLWMILLPISNLASLCHIWCMPSNSHGSEWTCFQENCLCCSVCANKAYHQHHQADITTLVIMMNLTALNYYVQMYVYCSLFANTSCRKISHKSYYFNSPLKTF